MKSFMANVEIAKPKTIIRLLVAKIIIKTAFILATAIDLRLPRLIHILKIWNKDLRYSLSCHSCNWW